MTNWLLAHASRKNIIILVLGYFAFPLYLLPMILDQGETGPFDLLFYYDADMVYQMLSAYGERLRHRYIIGLVTIDVIYPIYYSVLIAMMIAAIVKAYDSINRRLYSLILIPFLVMSMDFLENGMLVSLIFAYPEQLPKVASVVGYVTSLKWLLFICVIFKLLCLLIGLYREKASQRQQS
ncbi:hypothetical protein [Paraglaciecola sp.]|uniref:hypothetical protein n=1 Tax=Paraglaciecola sp. TaxID=1920173 RepID=UPI00273E4091|nr:hypothetical protein [Paraglaciecola sp.]MDP5032384.1 hypothetical protein [Paraglaciecola sp.]